MKFEFRPLRPVDFDQCLSLMDDRFAHDPEQLQAVPGFWLDILQRGLGYGAVVFNPNEPKRILAFGIRCFVDFDTADSFRNYEEPFLTRTMLDRWRTGKTPFLVEPDVGRANADNGVNLFVAHWGMAMPWTGEVIGAVMPPLLQGFIAGSRGLNIRIIIQEVFYFPREVANGLPVHIQELSSNHCDKTYPQDAKPFLIITAREHVVPTEGNLFALSLFSPFEPPHLKLSRPQRDLLRTALINDSDEWIAEILDVSLSAVKKRWQSIYDIMSGGCPDAFPKNMALRDGQRGVEKRKYVLHYIRNHPEELHPYSPKGNSDYGELDRQSFRELTGFRGEV
ncbi:MAG TPA: hypothetical protein VIX60_08860 [Candidatus Cybelea sp.]